MNSLQNKCVYVVSPDCQGDLCKELGGETHIEGNLVFSSVDLKEPIFAQDKWLHPKIEKIESIGHAAKILRAEKSIWHPNIINCARRSLLIAEKLPLYRNKPIKFPLLKPLPKIGSYSLLDENTLIYSVDRWKNIPNGEYHFEEDKINPPSRAYLKLWEALTFLGHYPKKGDKALDLGASPGGWTYVLQSLGAEVLAVDRAKLDDKIAALPGVSMETKSAFSLDPSDFDYFDWFVCDMACYPEKLWVFLRKWMESGKVGQFICTLKLQGETDFSVIEKFKSIPSATVIHLFHNKHEVTFLLGDQR